MLRANRSVAGGLFSFLLAVLLTASSSGQSGTQLVGLTPVNPDKVTPEFDASFGGQLGSLGWSTGDLLVAEFGTADDPITATVGGIVGGENVQVIPPVNYPNGQPLFDGVTADTRSGLRVSAEVYGRAGVVAGATLNFGGVSGNLDFTTRPQVELPTEIRAGRFFDLTGVGPGLSGSSSLDIAAPGIDFNLDLVLDVDARGTIEMGLYPFAGYRIGDFHLPDIFPDVDLCEVISFPANLANPDFNVCHGDPANDALLKLPITLPKPATPPGTPELPIIQIGEFQLVNPVAALETTTQVDPATKKLTINGNTDLLRLAADIDGIIGGALVGTSELSGGTRDLPSKENSIFKLSYDLIDVKYGPEFGYDFNASVDNKLDVQLGFSSPVLVGDDPTPQSSWSGPWDEIPQLALLSASAVDVDVDFTGFNTDLLYESRFTLADYLEIKAFELRLALNLERLGLGTVATAALKKALKIPALGPLLYDKRSLLGKAEFDDLAAIDLHDLIDVDLTTGFDADLWDGSFTLAPEPIEEVFLVNGTAPLVAGNFRKFDDPATAPATIANATIVLGTYAGPDPGTRLDAEPIDYLDVGGTLAVQGIYVPEGSTYRVFPGAARTFTGVDLLTIENDGVIAGSFNGTTGNLLHFSLDNENIPMFITGEGRIQFAGNDAAHEISAQRVIHDENHRLEFLDLPNIQAVQSIHASDSLVNLGEIHATSDLTITTNALTNGPNGEILAYNNGAISLERLLENHGMIRSIGNSQITINAGQATPVIEGPTDGSTGTFEAAQGGEIRFVGGFSRPFAGQLLIEATSGGSVFFEQDVTVASDSVVNLTVQHNSSMTLAGLSLSACIGCDEEAQAVITNHGLLELVSGETSLRVPSGFAGAEHVDDQIVPIDLTNTGTIRIHEGAELKFDFAIENYSGNGATFAGGTWELIGNPETFDNRTTPPNPTFFQPTPETWAYLDMQIGEVPRDAELIEVELPLDELATTLKFNAADVLLSGAALFPYFNTVEVNLGTIRLEQGQQFYTAGALENRDGDVTVGSGAGLIVHGPLTIQGGSVSVTGVGSKLEIVGGSFEQQDGSPGQRDIEINGGMLVIDDDAQFDATSGGRTWIVRDRSVDDGEGGTTVQPGVFDLGARQIAFNGNAITIEGENASFDAARYIESNAGALRIGRGHAFESLAPRFQNHAGATLALTGGRFLSDGPVVNLGALIVDEQSHLQASELRLLAGTAELDGLVEADAVVGPGATLHGAATFAYDLDLMPGSTLEVEFAGPDVMFDARVDGFLSILFPEDYAAPDEPGESVAYLLLQAETLTGAFDGVSLDGNLLDNDFGAGDIIVNDAGGGLTRTIRFLANSIELVETLGSPDATVPEPGAATLALLAIASGCLRRRPTRRRPRCFQQPRNFARGPRLLAALLAASLAVPVDAATFDWDRGAGNDLWAEGENWDQGVAIPAGDDILSFAGAAPPGEQTIDLAGLQHDVIRIEARDPDADYTIANGTLGLLLTGGNSILTRSAGGALTIEADVLFGHDATEPRFNVEPTAEPIVVTGNVSSAATAGTVTLELSSRNLALQPSVDVSGVISDGPGSQLALRAGFEADSENHRGVVRVTGVNTYTGPTTVNGAILEFNSIADADGTPSALGAPTDATQGRMTLGARDGGGVRSAGTLRYVGDGHSSNRELQLAGDGAGATILASGSGPLNLSGGISVETSSVDQVLTLGGDFRGDNLISGVIGANPGAGTLDLAKTGAGNWTLSAANLWQGTTNVSEGSLTIRGGSITTPARVSVGGPDHASLNLLLGGQVTAGELRIADGLADDLGGVNVDGAGSVLSVSSGTAYIGYDGLGQLGITHGGLVDAVDEVTVANGTSAVGVINIRGTSDAAPSTLSVGGTLRLGDDGNGTINLSDGGRLVTSAGGDFPVFIGNETGGAGSVVVSGAGSQWLHQAATRAIVVGNSGSFEPARAMLDVVDGGTVATHDLTIGSSKEGIAEIGGVGSSVTAEGFTIVGRAGKGSLAVRSGGALSATEGIDLGQNANGSGYLLVTGPGSTLDAPGNVTVGRDGAGTLIVEDQATAVVGGNLVAANTGGANGVVQVDGATVDVAGAVTIGLGPSIAGLRGEGRLEVTGGGQLNMNDAAGSIDVAAVNTVAGHVTVGDSDLAIPGSTLHSAGMLRLAPNGASSTSASITIRPTGLVDVAGTATLGTNGHLILRGGTIQAAAFNLTDRFNVQFDSGTIRIVGDQTLDAPTITNFGLDDNDNNPGTQGDPILLADQRLEIDGALTLNAPLVIDGGALSVGAVSGNDLSQLAPLFGSATGRTGALSLTNTSLHVAPGGMLGGALTLADDQTLDVAQAITFGAGGSLSIEGGTLGVGTLDLSGAATPAFSAGTLQFATIVGNLTVDGGTLAPGRRIGPATLAGNYVQTAGVLEIELGGPDPGNFDRLTVTGSATVDGTLSFQSASDYRGPDERGESHLFVVLSAASLDGAFAAIAYDGQELAPGVNYVPQPDPEGVDGMFRSVAITATDVTLTNYLAELGDADGNGLVDAGDLASWEASFGAAADFTSGDFDNDGVAGSSDFLAWQRNYAAAPLATATPEPATLWAAALGFGVLALVRPGAQTDG